MSPERVWSNLMDPQPEISSHPHTHTCVQPSFARTFSKQIFQVTGALSTLRPKLQRRARKPRTVRCVYVTSHVCVVVVFFFFFAEFLTFQCGVFVWKIYERYTFAEFAAFCCNNTLFGFHLLLYLFVSFFLLSFFSLGPFNMCC